VALVFHALKDQHIIVLLEALYPGYILDFSELKKVILSLQLHIHVLLLQHARRQRMNLPLYVGTVMMDFFAVIVVLNFIGLLKNASLVPQKCSVYYPYCVGSL
jgi:hypothetical protein